MTAMHKIRELDSFFTSRIILALQPEHASGVKPLLRENAFFDIQSLFSFQEVRENIESVKYDLLIIEESFEKSEELVRLFRTSHNDSAIIWITDNDLPLKKQLSLDISSVLKTPYIKEDLIKSLKKALSRKVDREIGMQFFDALFGMQMLTHRDMHQRTFDHAIRTTKIYGGFLFYLIEQDAINLTSWNFRNCLMASLVHDIGKLLLFNGILYKEGRLTQFEYDQVRRHPWYSVTALLGGHEITSHTHEELIKTVSGYNSENLSEQVKQWFLSIENGNNEVYSELQDYFTNMMHKPFIHSLNKDLLYIVFRHHDSVNHTYHDPKDLGTFSKIIEKPVNESLNPESYLDIVTNALAISDMFDALLDKKRNYRKNPYNKSFALFLIYVETKKGKFFPFLSEYFIKHIVSYNLKPEENIFCGENDPDKTLETIKRIDDSFKILHGQEEEFNRFLVERQEIIRSIHTHTEADYIAYLNQDWIDFYQHTHDFLINEFYNRLVEKNLISKNIEDFDSNEIKIFDMLFQFYYSFPSKIKQERILTYFIDSVTIKKLDEKTRNNIITVLNENKPTSVNEMNQILFEKGYSKQDLFVAFNDYDEDLLLTEFNQGIRKFHWNF
jgi:hypothetical protein